MVTWKKEILFVNKADTSILVSGLMREITIFQYLEISSQNAGNAWSKLPHENRYDAERQ